MAGIYEKVVGVITKPPEARKEREVKELLPWFCKKSELFASLKPDVVMDIIRNCQFKTLERDSVIIKQGEKGDCFYIILRGRVAIYINNAISDEDDASKIAERLEEAEKKALDEKGELDRGVFGNYIGIIEAGRSFGELALISKECVRNASIITEETVDLIVVNRELYNRSLRAAQAAEYEERTRFVQDNPLFRNWQPKYKKMMAMSIRKHIVQFDEYIVKQGEPAGDLFFLLRGQAKLVVEPSQHPHQYPNLYPLQDPDENNTDEEDEFLQVKKKEKEKYNEQERNLVMIAPSATRRKEKPRVCHEISLIGVNDIIGDTEFMLDLKTYMQSVVSTQVCHLYALDTKNYERLVVRRNPRTIDMIREHSEVKLMSRVLRLQSENKVPVMRTLLHKLQSINKPPQKRKDKRSSAFMSASYDFVPQRGPLIDIYGPGTVFYRNRQRERIKNKARHKADHFRGAKGGFGLVAPSNLTGNASQPIEQVHQGVHLRSDGEFYSDDEHGHDGYEYDEEEYAGSSGDEFPSDSSPKGRPAFGYPFVDREGSDKVLSELEERIKAWHAADWDGRSKTSKPKAVKMRRVTVEKTVLKPGAKVMLRKRKPLRPRIIIQADSDGEEGVTLNGAHPSTNREAYGSDIENEGAPRASVYRAGVQRAEEAAPVALPLHGFHHVQLTSPLHLSVPRRPTPRPTSIARRRRIRKSVSLPNLAALSGNDENDNAFDNFKLPSIYPDKDKRPIVIPKMGPFFAKIYETRSNKPIVLLPSGK